MMRSINSNNSGLTLVEILIAVIIFGLFMVRIVQAVLGSTSNFSSTKHETLAALLAQHIMAQVEAQFENTTFTESTETDTGKGAGVFEPYTWKWTLSKAPIEIPSLAAFMPENSDLPSSDADKFLLLSQILNENIKTTIRELSVEVSWTPFEGSKSRSFSLTTHLVDMTKEPNFLASGVSQ